MNIFLATQPDDYIGYRLHKKIGCDFLQIMSQFCFSIEEQKNLKNYGTTNRIFTITHHPGHRGGCIFCSAHVYAPIKRHVWRG